MLTKFTVNLIVLLPFLHSGAGDYGMDNIQNYRLNDDLKRFPVRSPDDLFGFEMPVNPQLNNNNPNNYNNDYEEYSEQNTVKFKTTAKLIPKKVQKTQLFNTYRQPMPAKPMKLIFSQYLSPHLLESDESYRLNPMDTFNDQYLAQLMPHIMSTAEQLAIKEENIHNDDQSMISSDQRFYDYFKSSQNMFDISGDSFAIKRSSNL